ncbi:hypothetical protein Patl1_33416 [Pistacia atlantica]|uniref:Uncharacterized protein n=1 Tax=Pistacia atlantica TaxID=434234 RepID=A0ACC0ZTC0_9ROSI|nr:hypothetical protein Patl1_33416 [Pistacia atlantica]
MAICVLLTGAKTNSTKEVPPATMAFWGSSLAKSEGFNNLSCLVQIVRGFIWTTLAISLLVKRTKSIQIFDVVPLPINLLLLFCAFRNFSNFASQLTEDKSLSEPLLGYSKPLVLEDIPSLVPEDEANLAYQKFANVWDSLVRENSNKSGNLVLQGHNKSLLEREYTHSNLEENLHEGLSIVGCLVITKAVESLSQRHCYFDSRRSGMRMRSALMVAVYHKQLKLSSFGRRRHSTGEIVNYIAVDAYRIGRISFVPLFICGLLNVPFAKMLQKCQSEFMVAQDERLRATSEILNSMKIIKLQSWEEKFKNLIESRRDREFKWLSESQLRKAYGTVVYWMSPTLISSVIFLGCALIGSAPLNASTIFTVLASLRSMGEPVRMIPEALSVMIQVKVSFDRINAVLLDDELKNDDVKRISLQNSDRSVNIQEGNFSWDPELPIPTLRHVNLEVKWGQKIAVCGSVGAGKSSLLDAITVLDPANNEGQEGTAKIDKDQMVTAEEPNGTSVVKENSQGEISAKGLPGAYWLRLVLLLFRLVQPYWLAYAIQFPKINNGILIGVYSGIATTSAVFVYFRSFYAALLGLKASKAFFSGFTNSIFKAPMLFFDSTPVGRILTRASSDLSVLDFDIPFAIIFVAAAGVELIAIIGIMTFVTWQVLIVAILAYGCSEIYPATARELIRINGTTKAPVMNYTAETSLGVITIRAFNMVDRIEAIQNFTLFTAAFLLVLIPKGYVAPGLVGLSLSYAFSLTGTQVFVSRWYCYLANYIISVERIKQFMHIPPEPPAIVEDKRPPSSWPFKGRIELQELQIRYRPNAPLVLKGITCTFSEGTRALEKCQLKATISSLPNKLDSSVSDEGENWSAGQRQLFCLGRVLLKRNRILVLDEATASIDSATDAILQRIIRQEFAGCTVITVAHRVPTVIDSDMVMVLSFGKLLEYDEPSKLMETNSSFSKLVAEYWSSCRKNSYQNLNSYQ